MGEGDVEMILARVRETAAGLRSRNALPCHETLMGLRAWARRRGMPEGRLLAGLAELRDSGRIEVGRTLNDWWIRPAEEGERK